MDVANRLYLFALVLELNAHYVKAQAVHPRKMYYTRTADQIRLTISLNLSSRKQTEPAIGRREIQEPWQF